MPLQCDGRPLTPWLDGATPADWRREVYSEFDFRDPDGRMFEQIFGLTLEECSLAVLRDAGLLADRPASTSPAPLPEPTKEHA